jgi:hypothetical protein
MVSRSRVTTSDMRRGVAAALLVLLHVTAGAAQSSQAETKVRAYLQVDAEESCATEVLAQRVRERSPRIELVEEAGDVPRLHVSIRVASAGDRVAVLSVQWPDSTRSERRIKARSCEAAIDALGLLIAMTLDPAARMESAKSAPPAQEANEPSALAPKVTETTAAKSGEPIGPAERANASAPQDAEDAAPHAHPLGASYVAVGLSAQVVAGPAPRAMPGFGLYARLAFHGAALWVPAIELRAGHAWVDGLVEPDGQADFALDSAKLDVCPLGVRLASLTAHACLTGEVGRFYARGSRSYAPRTHHLLWTSLGGTLLLALALGSIVELQGGFDVAAPLRRDRFSFRPDVFHEVEALSLSAYLGVGVRFP